MKNICTNCIVPWVGGIALLLLGGLIGYTIHQPQRIEMVHSPEMSSLSGMGQGGMDMGGAMDGMMAGLTGKTGKAFDRAFLTQMIMHHQGAVDMAQAALEHAERQEIKDMAQAIISTQTAEITQMQKWQAEWSGK